MATILILDVTDSGGWLAHERSGQPWRRGDALPAHTRIVAIVPAEAVTRHRVRIPARRGAELRQAVPFALEERLAEPVEDLHFAVGTRVADQIEVAVVARRALQAWLEALSSSHMPDTMVADAQLLPCSSDGIHLAQVGPRLLLSCDDLVTALPAEDWPRWRQRLPSLPLRWLGADGRFTEAPVASAQLDHRAWLRYVASRVAECAAPNLLQAEFAPRRQAASRQRQLRWAAALAGLAVLLALVEAGVGAWTEQHRRNALRTEIETVFQQALPEHRMTADPAAQFASELARQRRGGRAGGAFELLNAAAPLITQGSRYRLEAIDYRLGILEIEIETGDVASLDGLREALSVNGLAVEVTGVNPQQGGVRGRLRLRGGGA